MTLAIQHRPKVLSEIFGNKAVVESIETIMSRKSDFPHAILLHGQTGTGKTTIARILATMLESESIEEYNMSNTRGIDTIRELQDACQYLPMMGNTRVYVFDECQRMTKDAQSALLKLLEDPPSHVFFVLCTTDPEQLLPTVRGRCHTYQTRPLKSDEMMALLKSILKKEKVEDYPEKILREIALLSEGLPRNALVLLDGVIDLTDEDTALAALSTISTVEANVKDICQAILKKESWDSIRETVKNVLLENEPEKIRQAVLGYMTAVVLNSKSHDKAVAIIDIFSETIFYNGRSGIVKMIYAALKQ